MAGYNGWLSLRNLLLAMLAVPFFSTCRNNSSADAYRPVFAQDTTENALIVGFPSFSYSESAQPMIKYLNDHLSGIHLKIKACTRYEEFLEYIQQNKFDITFPNGIIALDCQNNGYSIVGKLSDDSQYRGIIFTRKDAGIKETADLNGRSIAMVAHDRSVGTMMPILYLHERGVDVHRDIRRVNVSSFESAIISTFVGKTDAGLCLKRNWTAYVKQYPETLSKLTVAWETPALPNSAIVVKNSMDPQVSGRILELMFTMQNTPEGKKALAPLEVVGFEKADSVTYKPFLEFKKKYDAIIY